MALRFPIIALRAALAIAPVATCPAPALAQDAEPDGTAPPAASDEPGCAGAIARWQDFAAREDQGGHMDASVHAKIQDEIARADRLCQAGQDAQARRAVAESRRRHGY